MKKFAYARASSIEQAQAMLSESVRPKGGGMDLLDLAKRGVSTPDVMLDVRGIESFGLIENRKRESHSLLYVGAGVTLAQLAASADVRTNCPVLAEAAEEAATPQVRNVATLAGNLLQRPRCSYLRDPFFDCIKRGGKTCPAMQGVHDEGAIFGNKTCCAVHPSNLAPALMAANASVTMWDGVERKRESKWRSRKAADLFLRPEMSPLSEADVGPDHLVTRAVVPYAPASAYVEINHKQSFDWAAASCAVSLQVEDGKVKSSRVVLGAVAPVPWWAEAAERALIGKAPTEKAALAAAEAAAKGATPLRDNVHKVRLVRTVVKRAILKAAERSG